MLPNGKFNSISGITNCHYEDILPENHAAADFQAFEAFLKQEKLCNAS
jgi:hypothetical protein